jgi:poly(hydroxyalkanoate) depolymerase family esterase
MSILDNINYLRQLSGLGDIVDGFDLTGLRPESDDTRLVEQVGFGSNPGELRMFSFVPSQFSKAGALVVVLHGCKQTAASHDMAAGWSHLAQRYGFALLMPQQSVANNARGCFNWFQPEDVRRDSGEAGSICQMINHMVAGHDIDKRKIFITGLSAGGAMTTAMLAIYPKTFAAGAIVAGLPYGIAGNVRQALSAMYQSLTHTPHELGDLVRAASAHRGPWPRISIWHGSSDRVVNPGNADELVKQWCNVHGIDLASTSTGVVDGHPHQVWWNDDGETMVESYTISDMAHGTPLGNMDEVDEYGSPGQFAIEAGISSSYHIASFFGLTRQMQKSGTDDDTRQAGAATGNGAFRPAISPQDLHKDARFVDGPAALWTDLETMIARALTAIGLKN